MYTNILVPVAPDHQHETSKAMQVAQRLCAEGGKITLLSVVEAIPGYVARYLPEGQMEKNRKEIEASLKPRQAACRALNPK